MDEAPLLCVLRGKRRSRPRKMLGPLEADAARQKPRESCVGDEPDVTETEAELGRRGRERDVGVEGEAAAGTVGVALHLGEDGLRDFVQESHDAVESAPEPIARRDGIACELLHHLDVAACAEVVPCGLHDHDPYVGIIAGLLKSRSKGAEGLQVEGVLLVGAVEAKAQDAIRQLRCDRGHAASSGGRLMGMPVP